MVPAATLERLEASGYERNSTDNVIGQGHPSEENDGSGYMENRRDGACADDSVHIVNAGISPHATVEAEGHEDDESQHRIPGGEAHPGGHISIHRDRPQLTADKEPLLTLK